MQRRGLEPRGHRVADLLELVSFSGQARDRFRWADVEKSIGLTLPDDYKELVESFSSGYFQDFVQIIRPGDMGASKGEFLGYYAHRLEDMRQWRNNEPTRFPLPIFPEPGGLLPWGRSIRSDLFFWLTEGENPANWPIVATDSEFTNWASFNRSVCDFLIDVVTGQYDGQPFGVHLRADFPKFQTMESLAPGLPEPSTENYWIERNHGSGYPQNAFDKLNAIIGEALADVSSVEWESIEARLGFDLPSDYKAFVDTYGPGQLGDITIAGPVGDSSLGNLADRIHAEAVANPRRRPERHAPIHPEPNGMIPWGVTPDGWSCCWAPTTSNPDNWGTVLLSPLRINFRYSPDESFSSFLVRYATPEYVSPFMGRDQGSPDQIEFTPR